MRTYKEDLSDKDLKRIITLLLKGKKVREVVETMNMTEYAVNDLRLQYLALLRAGFPSEVMREIWDKGTEIERAKLDEFCWKNCCDGALKNSGCV